MNQIVDVTTLNRYAKAVLARDEGLSSLVVCGEVSNFVRHAKSGHCYFSLRDARSSIKCVMFSKNARLLEFGPQDGMMVLAYGAVTLYERDGAFQLYVDYMRPYGKGAIQQAFDQLKEKLGKEGLFDPAHKKPLPGYPQTVGVVTSATGAALQDIKNVMSRRWPCGRLLLAPVNVQGVEAADQIAAAIRQLDASGRADVILVARGGGSREDLWVFNSEKIARAAFACRTPLVSAVGHEIDYTILDYVADLRAPTPSAAAELCLPDREELLQKICKLQQNIQFSIQSRLKLCYNQFSGLQADRQRTALLNKLSSLEFKVSVYRDSAQKAAHDTLGRQQAQLAADAAMAHSLDPYGVLARGYAMVSDHTGALTTADRLNPGDTFWLEGSHTRAECRVNAVQEKGED